MLSVGRRVARGATTVAVQRFYDGGHSVADCVKAFGFSKQTWHAAVNAGRIIPRPAQTPIAELCVAGTPRSRGNLKRRLLREGLKEERCEGCGLHQWQGVPLPLALHHVNGDRDDNRLIIPGATCHLCQAAGGERRRHVVDGPCARRRRVSDAPPAEGRRDVSVMLGTMGVLDL
jgi:hypothetical protein